MPAPPPRTPEDLLKWSIAAQGANGESQEGQRSMHEIAQDVAEGRRPDLADPGLFNALMGKSEATMMQEELSVAMNLSRSEQDRVQALDNFEMLIESIDNANNIKSMKMWEPIISLLSHPQSTAPIQHAALWIIGTAVQNNDKAQMTVLDYDILSPLLHLLKSSTDGEVRSKAMYALSGILKHNAKAVDLFSKVDGFETLKDALLDSNVSLRRKAAFLVNALLLQDDSINHASTSSTSETSNIASDVFRSTAVIAVDQPTPSAPSAPLEQLPATLTSGVNHPSIPPLLISSNLLQVLILSLLSATLQSSIPSSILNSLQSIPTAGGPDGDIELREDLDFAEKGCQTCITFVEKVKEQGGLAKIVDKNIAEQIRSLLVSLGKELEGKSIEQEQGITLRWQELGFDKAQIDSFTQSIKTL